MTGSRSIVAALALVVAACRAGAPPEPAPEVGCVGCLPVIEGDRAAPLAHAFEVDVYEMPVARATELFRAPDASSSSIAIVIDEKGMRELAARDPLAKSVRSATFEAAAGSRALVPDRRDAGSDRAWSDGLRLELGAGPGKKWAAHELDFAGTWISPQGERLATTGGSTPLPPDHDVLVWCLPAQSLADAPEPRTARAVLAIVRLAARY